MKQVSRPIVEQATGRSSDCKKCGGRIHSGQLWVVERHEHVACPTPRQVERERLWDRARAILKARS